MVTAHAGSCLEERTCLCEVCLAPVPTEVIIADDGVYYRKHCPAHGEHETLLSTDVPYFLRCEQVAPQGHRPAAFQKPIAQGCPWDCGLCEAHEQRTAAAVLEITDTCNMACPTCDASSLPTAGSFRSLSEIAGILDLLDATGEMPGIVMISGGEPTCHPQLFDLLALVRERTASHLMLITNGLLLANDKALVNRMPPMGEDLEVYLQFDCLDREALLELRGADLREVRVKALDNLEAAGVPTTLVCVVKRGVNDLTVNDTIDLALQYECVRGVTFQPLRVLGRYGTFDKEKHLTTLSHVRTRIIKDSSFITDSNFLPHSSSPETVSIAYFLKRNREFTPVSHLIMPGAGDVPEGKHTFPLERAALSRGTALYFTPSLDTPGFHYHDLFRVAVVSLLDRFNFSVEAARRSCIHVMRPEGAIVPLDLHYLFYSGPARSGGPKPLQEGKGSCLNAQSPSALAREGA